MATLYTPGMTIDQFRAKLQADPGFQQVVRSAARLPNGQFTPQGWLAISRYAGSSGLNDLNLAQIHSGDPHRSTYSIDGNGGILEQHDGKGPEFWGPLIVGAVAGGAIAAPYVVGAAGTEGAGAGGAGAFDAAGNFIGDTTISSVGGGGLTTAAGTVGAAGVTGTDLLKYALPTAGNLVGGLIQADAAGKASDAQQRYLEEALAYQKESDLYNRNRQATLDAQEVQRYGDYQGRIAPFIANGVTSNDRMAALLGLPARSGSSGSNSGDSTGSPIGTGQNFDPTYIGQQLDAEYAKHGLTATGPGTGPTDKAYFIDAIRKNKGWDPGYWSPRITDELRKAGIADRPPTSSGASAPPAASAAPSSAASVQMRGPDGSVKTVSADQVDHYKSLGATVLGAAA